MRRLAIPDTMKELVERVESKDGVSTVLMSTLRDAYGSERLGKNVRMNITAMLQQLGVGHTPSNLPPHQDRYVRLYKLGSPVGKLIQAALRPGSQNDELLRRHATSETVAILEKVKELVCS